MKTASLALGFLFGAAPLLTGCVSSEHDKDSGGFFNQGWIEIEAPTEAPIYETSRDSVYLLGKAFVSPDYWHCCPLDPAVMVTWSNGATGESGQASSEGYFSDLFFKIPKHRWSTTVPLAEGDNPITVSAVDPDGHHGNDSITVTYIAAP